MGIAYLNGDFTPLDETKISVLDRGFLFGDSVYEVIPVYQKKPFCLDEHMLRLQHSLSAIGIDLKMSENDWKDIFTKLIESTEFENQSIYVQVTRGIMTDRNHKIPDSIKPTVFAYSKELISLEEQTFKNGIKVALLEDIRWQRCDIKATTLLPNILLYQQAQVAGFEEAILMRNDFITEACISNVFLVKRNQILTPPLSNSILGGITREFLIKTALEHNFDVQEMPITSEQLLDADEIWLTSSTKELRPVVSVNDKTIGSGVPGPTWHELFSIFRDAISSLK